MTDKPCDKFEKLPCIYMVTKCRGRIDLSGSVRPLRKRSDLSECPCEADVCRWIFENRPKTPFWKCRSCDWIGMEPVIFLDTCFGDTVDVNDILCPSCGHPHLIFTGTASEEDKFWSRYFPSEPLLEDGDADT
jgi:hypothetical protein